MKKAIFAVVVTVLYVRCAVNLTHVAEYPDYRPEDTNLSTNENDDIRKLYPETSDVELCYSKHSKIYFCNNLSYFCICNSGEFATADEAHRCFNVSSNRRIDSATPFYTLFCVKSEDNTSANLKIIPYLYAELMAYHVCSKICISDRRQGFLSNTVRLFLSQSVDQSGSLPGPINPVSMPLYNLAQIVYAVFLLNIMCNNIILEKHLREMNLPFIKFSSPRKRKDCVSIKDGPPRKIQKIIKTNCRITETKKVCPIVTNRFDVDIIFVKTMQIAPFWLYTKRPSTNDLNEYCSKLNLEHFFNNISQQYYPIYFQSCKRLKIVKINRDGHCGYSSLSFLLTGSTEGFMVIRNTICTAVINGILPLQYYQYCGESTVIQEFETKYNVNDALLDQYWMSEYDIIALSIILEVNILVFDRRFNQWMLFNRTCLSFGPMATALISAPSFMLYFDENHYSPIIQID